MKSAVRPMSLLSLSLFVVSLLSLLPRLGFVPVTKAGEPAPGQPRVGQTRPLLLPIPGSRAFISYKTNGTAGCREASESEAKALTSRASEPLHIISADRSTRTQNLSIESTGLQIVLRG